VNQGEPTTIERGRLGSAKCKTSKVSMIGAALDCVV